VRPVHILGMGGLKDVTDERPVGRGDRRPRWSEPRPDGGWHRPRRKRRGRLHQ